MAEREFEVTQTRLSRDLKDLRVAKVPHAEGESYYAAACKGDGVAPALGRLLPHSLIEGIAKRNQQAVEVVQVWPDHGAPVGWASQSR